MFFIWDIFKKAKTPAVIPCSLGTQELLQDILAN